MGFAQSAGAPSNTGKAEYRLEWAERRRAACVRLGAAFATFPEAEVDGRHGTRHICGLRQQLAETAA